MSTTSATRPAFLTLVAIGVVAGLMSGLFGVGGGLVLVPMLVGLLGYGQRIAAGTSSAAIVPTAITGALTYASAGNVDWVVAIALAAGMIVGAQIGSLLLARLPTRVLTWAFVGYLAVVAVSLWFVVPDRDAQVDTSAPWVIGLLVVIGLVVGAVSGPLGVGGGVIVVPALIFFFSASDLIARGSSLAMLVPGALSGTVANVRRGNVDVRSAIILGLAACATSPLGAIVATIISPFWSNVTFSVLLVCITIQMSVRALRKAD